METGSSFANCRRYNWPSDKTKTLQLVDLMTKQSGTSDRTFKSALIWCVPDSRRQLCDEARKLLAWEDIQEEASELKLEELQRKQLTENQGKSKRGPEGSRLAHLQNSHATRERQFHPQH